jgi:hypothetical protein
MQLRGKDCSRDDSIDPERFKRNFKLAMGVEEREYEGVVQDCKLDDKLGWIPWDKWRHLRIEEDRAIEKAKRNERNEHKSNILIGMKNYNPVEFTRQTKTGMTTESVCKVIYK